MHILTINNYLHANQNVYFLYGVEYTSRLNAEDVDTATQTSVDPYANNSLTVLNLHLNMFCFLPLYSALWAGSVLESTCPCVVC